MKLRKKKVGKFLSRKLIILLVLFICATSFLIFNIGSTTFQTWANFALILYGLYIGGNVGSQLISKKLTQQQYADQRKRKYQDQDDQAL